MSLLAISSVSVVNINDGQKGEKGDQGDSVVSEKKQYYLSTSTSALSGGSWSDAYPEEIPPSNKPNNKYLWERTATTLSDNLGNNTVIYSSAVYNSLITGISSVVDSVEKSITDKVWETDISASIDAYDGSTTQAIRDDVSQMTTDISGIRADVETMESIVNTKADGSALEELSRTVSTNEQTANKFRQTVQSTYVTKNTFNSLSIGTHNYIDYSEYIDLEHPTYSDSTATYYSPITTKDGAYGMLLGSNSTITVNIQSQNMSIDKNYIFSFDYCTNSTEDPSCYFYVYFNSINMGSGGRSNASKWGRFVFKFKPSIKVPTYVEISSSKEMTSPIYFRHFQLEEGTLESDWHPSEADARAYTDTQISTTRSLIEQTADGINIEVAKKVNSDEVISAINLYPGEAKIDANKIDLIGSVSFSMLDPNAQNRINEIEESSPELIIGTQTKMTSAWTGNSNNLSSLKTGTKISYMLSKQSTGSSVTLNLTLKDGVTTTGPIDVYYYNTHRLSNQYPPNSIIDLIYDGENWRVSNPYTDTYDRVQYSGKITVGNQAITYNNIIVADSDAQYFNLKSGQAFNITYPILWTQASIPANSTGYHYTYLAISHSLAGTQSQKYEIGKAVYIKGTLSGLIFTPISTTPLTQTVPTEDDGYHYIYLGTTYDNYNIYLVQEHPIYKFYNGAFKTTSQIAEEAAVNADTALLSLEQIAIKNIVTTYGTSTSASTQPTEWDSSVPAWVDGQYIWQKTVTTDKDDVKHIDIICLTGQKGATGGSGAKGADAYTVILSNESHTFQGLSGGVIVESEIPVDVIAYKGTTRIATGLNMSVLHERLNSLPNGFTVTYTGKDTNAMCFTFGVTDGLQLNHYNGTFTIPIMIDNIQFDKTFSYSCSLTGSNGYNTANVSLYKRASSTPDKIKTIWNYNFNTKALTSSQADGWQPTIPSGTNPCYVTMATATSTGNTDTISASEWSQPMLFVKNGASGDAGLNQATLQLYRRAINLTDEDKPTEDVSYSFSSGVLGQISNWSRTIPDDNGLPCWVTTAVAIGVTTSVQILKESWSTPAKMVADSTAYSIILSHHAIVRNENGSYSPTSIILTAKQQTGQQNMTDYSGRFKVEYTTNHQTWTVVTNGTSTTDESSRTQTIPSNIAGLRCSLYLAGGTDTLLDQQTIPVISNGVGITSIVAYYCIKGTKPTTTPKTNTTEWKTAPPTYVNGQKYWLSNLITYTDGTTEATAVVEHTGINTAISLAEESKEKTDAYISENELIIGTQTKNTAQWTGNSQLTSLKHGQMINYWLPYAYDSSDAFSYTPSGTNATAASGVCLTLKLKDGTSTEKIPCFYGGTSRLTSHYTAGNSIKLTYMENVNVGAFTIAKGWWSDANYTTGDTVDNRIVNFAGKTGDVGVWAWSIFMRDGNGTYQNVCTASDGMVTTMASTDTNPQGVRTEAKTKKANTHGFEVNSPIWVSSKTYNKETNMSTVNTIFSGYGNVFDARFSFNVARASGELITYKPVYLVGTIQSDDGLFYLDTVWWTQAPNNESKVYILVGNCYDCSTSNIRINLFEDNPWVVYRGGKLVEYNTSLALLADDKASRTLGMKTNYSAFNTSNNGECYLHGYDASGNPADISGYVYWNGLKRIVPKAMLNPGNVLPFLKNIYIVLRLSSATSSSGTLYLVWWDTAWKHSITEPSAINGNWTWNEATDVVLGQFVGTTNEGPLIDAYLYEPPRNASHILTTGDNAFTYSKSAVDWVKNNGPTTLNATDMLKFWTNNALDKTTKIQGGYIATNTIEATNLATDAIMSSNYQASTGGDSPYSAIGTFLDLSNGNFWTPNFGVINVVPNGTTVPLGAWFNGNVTAGSGKFGSDSSYWNIENVYDYNMQEHAALVGTGSPYLQTFNWQVSDNAIATRKYTSTAQYSGKTDYYKHSASNTFYDVGMKIPTVFIKNSNNDNAHDRYNRAFFYMRKYTGDTIPSQDAEWQYPFMVDSEGRIYATDIIISGSSSISSNYLALSGGTIDGPLTVTGNVTINGTLNAIATSAQTLTSTLSVSKGGTGATSFTSGYALIGNGTGAIQTRGIKNLTSAGHLGWTVTSTDNTLVTTNTLAFWNGRFNSSYSNLEYVKLGKLGSVVTHSIDEFITTSGGIIDGSLQVVDLTSGSLVVNGVGRFTNGIYGNLTGSVTGNVVGNVSGTAKTITDTLPITKGGTGATTAVNARTNLEVMYNPRITTSATPDTFDSEGLYRIMFTHTNDTTWPATMYGDLFVSNHGTAYQIYIPDNSMAVYKRIYNNSNSTWGAWSNIWDITATKAKQDEDGNVIKSTYAKLTGAIFTGDVKIKKSSSIADNSPARITFVNDQTDNNISTGGAYISVYDDHDDNQNGQNMVIRSSGNMFIGGGESPQDLYNEIGVNSTSEQFYLTSDNNMYFYAKCQNISERLGMILMGDHTLLPIKGVNTVDNEGSIGRSDRRWKDMYAVTFHGALDGNATSATSATSATTATTASKFSSTRKIELTGNVLGSATTDGSSGWTISTTVDNISSHGLSSKDLDDYKVTQKVNFYYGGGGNQCTNVPIGDGVQFGLIAYASAAGHVTQECASYSSSSLHGKWIRFYNATSWSAWEKFLTSGNYTDYTVTKAGTGATGTWGIGISGNSSTTTKLKTAVNITVGNETQSFDGSKAISFAKTDISGVATSSSLGWMSKDDKVKLDSINITSDGGTIGTVGANNIVGTDGIKASVTNGIATISHNNSISGGTVTGTSNSGNVAFGSTISIPTFTYDNQGHITEAGTTTFKLPATPTSISGNAGTATKFSSTRKIELTGDVTGSATADGSSGWSITATGQAIYTKGRQESMDIDFSSTAYNNRITYMHAASITTTHKPEHDANVINLGWQNNKVSNDLSKWGSQVAVTNSTKPTIYLRGCNNGTWDEDWLTVLSSNNYKNYTVGQDGTGATGTWGIGISGNSATTTKLKTAVNLQIGNKSQSFDGSTGLTYNLNDLGITRNNIKAITSKTYTGILGTASNNAAEDSFYFLKVRPSTFNIQWKLKYRITATISGQNNFHTTSTVTLYGTGQANSPASYIYNQIYNTSYRPIYYNNFYRLTSAGYSAGLSNAIGVGLRNSNNRDTSGYARTLVVEILENENCTYVFLDSPVKWANWANGTTANYAGLAELDAYTNGQTTTGDRNNYDRTMHTYTHLTAGQYGIRQNSLIMEDSTGRWQSFTTNDGTGTSKTKNASGFKLGQMYYMSGSAVGNGSATGNNTIYSYFPAIDLRYSTNCGQTLQANKPLWIIGTMNNGLFYLDATWYTQTPPTTADGKVYIPLGIVYDATATSTVAYQIDFIGWHGAYYHNGTAFIQYTEASAMTSILQVSQGGTGTDIFASRAVLYGNASNPILCAPHVEIMERKELSVNGGTKYANGIFLYGDIPSNAAADLVSNTANILSYGDGGPQIRFADNASGGQAGALIYNHLDGFAPGCSFHFVSNQADWSVVSKRFVAKTSVTIGENVPNTTYSLYVNGSTVVNGAFMDTSTTIARFDAGIRACNSNGTGGGLSLYNTVIEDYGIMFRTTASQMKHGYVQGTHAVYFNVSGSGTAERSSAQRGWIFRDNQNTRGVASITGNGDAAFNGKVAIGTTATDISGSCSLEMDRDLGCLNFVFN